LATRPVTIFHIPDFFHHEAFFPFFPQGANLLAPPFPTDAATKHRLLLAFHALSRCAITSSSFPPMNHRPSIASSPRKPSKPKSLTSSTGSHRFFYKYNTNANTHTCMSTHPYEHTHAHPTPMSTFERLIQLDLEIHEVSHQERITIDGDDASH
jgi:hypothetical protein